MLARPVNYTRLSTNDENNFSFTGLACLALAQQDPERGGYNDVNGPRRLYRDPAMRWVWLLIWPFLLLVFFCATLALTPAIAETRAGSSVPGQSSSMPARPAPRPA